MFKITRKLVQACLLILMLTTLFFLLSLSARGQEPTTEPSKNDWIQELGIDYPQDPGIVVTSVRTGFRQ
jgi:hypothetical protein